jgi:ADP-ribose pyrophosphatase
MQSRIEKRNRKLSGRAFNVEEVNVRLPDGRLAGYDLVDHVGSVTIVPLDKDGNLYFVRQYRIGSEKEILELPAGTLSKNESPRHCALREIREEVGLKAGRLTMLGDFFLAPGYSTEHMYIFLATDLGSGALPGDEDEFLTVMTMPIRKALKLVHRNQIKDCKTIAALMLAMPVFDRLRFVK